MARVKRFLGGHHGTTYTCRCCGKKTRETGECESGCVLCARCYEISGLENTVSDCGEDSPEGQAAVKRIADLHAEEKAEVR